MADQLIDSFRARKAQAPYPEINWLAKRDAWIEPVESLYVFIEKLLRDSIASKDVTVRTVDREVTEDFIGTYSIPA